MPVDPQVEALLKEFAAQGRPPLYELSVDEARTAAEEMVALAGDPIEVGSVRDISIPVDGASIAARVYSPQGAGPHPVVMFFHGGGWVICGLDTHDNVCRAICRDADAIVVSVAYRMAPEHRFPVAAHDCFAATRWVADNAATLGGDASRLAVCGDSAGGNLSAVVSHMARDAGGPALAFAALIYPAVDMTAEGGSMTDNANGYFLEEKSMRVVHGSLCLPRGANAPHGLAVAQRRSVGPCRRASSPPASSTRCATRARRTVPRFGPAVLRPRPSATTA